PHVVLVAPARSPTGRAFFSDFSPLSSVSAFAVLLVILSESPCLDPTALARVALRLSEMLEGVRGKPPQGQGGRMSIETTQQDGRSPKTYPLPLQWRGSFSGPLPGLRTKTKGYR